MEEVVEAEFSRIIDVPSLARKENPCVEINAKENELEKLAKRFNYSHVEHLSLQGKITPKEQTDMFHFAATIDFKITPFSNDTFSSHITEEIELIFAPNNGSLDQRMEEIDLDIEPMEFGSVDIGEVAAQYMYLIFETVQLENNYKEDLSSHIDEQKINPFSKLNDLLKEK